MSILDGVRLADFITSLRSDPDPRTHQFIAYFLSAKADVHTWKATPNSPDTTLNNLQIVVALSMKLLEPLTKTTNGSLFNSKCFFNCSACNSNSVPLTDSNQIASKFDIDPYGYHSFRCSTAGLTLRTKLIHDVMVSMWVRLLRHAGFIVTVEPSRHFDQNRKRPDACWEVNGHFVYVDFRTCDPLLKSNVFRASDCPGTGNHQGQVEKDNSWYNLIHSRGDEFIALCHEYPGKMGDPAVSLLQTAASRFSSNLQQQNIFKEFWLQRLHMAFVRGTCDLLLKRLPVLCSDTSQSSLTSNNLLPAYDPLHTSARSLCNPFVSV